jgi:hypothetical protein
MKIKMKINIKSNSEKIFSFLSDAEKQKLWVKELVKIEYENPKDPASNFTLFLKEGGKINAYNGYTKYYNIPHNLVVVLSNPNFTVETNYSLIEQKDGSTTLYYSCHLIVKSFFARMFTPLAYIFSKIILKKQLKALKQCAETN